MDLRSFVAWREEIKDKERKRLRKILFSTTVGALVFIILSFTSVNGDKADYTVKVNGNKVDNVKYVDNVDDLASFFAVEKKSYIVQSEDYKGFDELEKVSKTLDKKGYENLIFVEEKLIKLQLNQSFSSREEAENFAAKLEEEGLIDGFKVRLK